MTAFRLVLSLACLLLAPVLASAQSAAAQEFNQKYERATALSKAGKFKEAIPLAERCYALVPQVFAADSDEAATMTFELGVLYLQTQQADRAEPFIAAAYKKFLATKGENNPTTISVLHDYGVAQRDRGLLNDALKKFKKSAAVYEQLEPQATGADKTMYQTRLALARLNLAGMHEALGDYGEAERLTRIVIDHYRRTSPNSMEMGQCYVVLGTIMLSLGQNTKAEEEFRKALKLTQQVKGPNSQEAIKMESNLGVVFERQERYEDAKRFQEASIKRWEAQFGKTGLQVANMYNHLGGVHYKLKQTGPAEVALKHSIKQYRAALGANNPEAAYPIYNLGKMYLETARYDEAVPLLEQTKQIYQKRGLSMHSHMARVDGNLADLYAHRGEWARAAEYMQATQKNLHGYINRALPALSENEQLSFLKFQSAEPLELSYSIGVAQKDDPKLVALSAGWVLNGKAVVHETLAQRTLLARRAAGSKDAQELQSVRRQLAAVAMSGSASGQFANQLIADENRLVKALGQSAGVRNPVWVEVDAVRKALPAEAVLIDIAKFRMRIFGSKIGEEEWSPPRYAAWVIPPAGKGELRVIDLGEAEKVEALVAKLREQVQAAPAAIRELGEVEAEAMYRAAAAPLAELVLLPLVKAAGDASQLWLSPDAGLWLVPWAALPLDAERYAAEQYNIKYLVSGRDVLRPGVKLSTATSVVLANPDYDLKPAQLIENVRNWLKLVLPSADKLRAIKRGEGLPRVEPLPGTAAEAKAIEPIIKSFVPGGKLNRYEGKYAMEQTLKLKTLAQPRVLVLSTHGFFLADQHVKPRDAQSADLANTRSAITTTDGKRLEDPLLRCGLMLAGCNQPDAIQSGEDGVLTGKDILELDLRGTELVVLSACETGLGEVRNGEGVAGLRTAFQLAGAQSVVATLWQIADDETAALMTEFFKALAKGADKSAALRTAQLERIKARRERNGAAHPFFWAAFTVTGHEAKYVPGAAGAAVPAAKSAFGQPVSPAVATPAAQPTAAQRGFTNPAPAPRPAPSTFQPAPPPTRSPNFNQPSQQNFRPPTTQRQNQPDEPMTRREERREARMQAAQDRFESRGRGREPAGEGRRGRR